MITIKITSWEREDHIATGRNLSPEEELLPLHGGGKQRRWRWIRGHLPVPAGYRRMNSVPPPPNCFSLEGEIGIASGEKRSGIRVSSAGVKIGAKGGTGGTHQSARRAGGAA